MNDGRMHDEFTGVVWAQLTTNGLFDLHGHTPGPNEFGPHLREVAPNVGLFYLGQRSFEIPGFDKGDWARCGMV